MTMKLITPKYEIVVQSPKKFKALISDFREVCEFPNYRINDGVSSKEHKFSANANTCTLLGMNNGVDTYLGHYAPEYKKPDFKEKLDYIVKKFQDKTGELDAVIAGGYSYDVISNPQAAKDSFTLVAQVGEVLDKNGANLTVIAGKRVPSFVDNLAVTEDKFVLSHSPNYATCFLNYPEPEVIKNASQLDAKYEIFEPSETHKLSFDF